MTTSANTTINKAGSDAETILRLSELATTPIKDMGPIPFVRLPEGSTVASLEEYLPTPARIREDISFQDLQSFLDYVDRYKTTTLILAESAAGRNIKAVFDYHPGAGAAGWCRHVAWLKLRLDPIFERWVQADGLQLSQAGFAEFLELNALGITDPSAAEVMEVARTIQGVRNAEFESGVRTTNGDTQLRYSITTTAKAGEKGQLDIPEKFVIRTSVYMGADPTFVTIRLFWRIDDNGRASFTLRILQKDTVMEDALILLRHTITAETKVNVWLCP